MLGDNTTACKRPFCYNESDAHHHKHSYAWFTIIMTQVAVLHCKCQRVMLKSIPASQVYHFQCLANCVVNFFWKPRISFRPGKIFIDFSCDTHGACDAHRTNVILWTHAFIHHHTKLYIIYSHIPMCMHFIKTVDWKLGCMDCEFTNQAAITVHII